MDRGRRLVGRAKGRVLVEEWNSSQRRERKTKGGQRRTGRGRREAGFETTPGKVLGKEKGLQT